jgi:hypothetical protein
VEIAQDPNQLKRLPEKLGNFMSHVRRVSEGRRKSCRLLEILKKITLTPRKTKLMELKFLNHSLRLKLT